MEENQTINRFSVLVVDDEQDMLHSMKRFFRPFDFNLDFALNGEEALHIISKKPVNLMLLDLKMPGMNGLEVLKQARQIDEGIKIIIHTAHGAIADAVEALKMGASDFLEKGNSPEILRARIKNAYELWETQQENRQLKKNVLQSFNFDGFIGESPPVQKLKEMIARVAPSDASVLIQGESGTGKELVAQAIHHHSQRKNGPVVVVDCAAISETVLESELFGHSKGAFTGADTPAVGLIRSADKGTLFLDEIGELSTSVQGKRLRTIQEREVRPVGSTKSYPVDIRIIAATNRTLLDEISTGGFRQDLYYRLSAVTLTSPPLRTRGISDIKLLVEYFLKKLPHKSNNITEITKSSIQCLADYDWPGNIRELENTIQSALVFSNGSEITLEDLPELLSCKNSEIENISPEGTLAYYELQAIKNALKQSDNNRRKAANILDIAEATLYRKIKQFNL